MREYLEALDEAETEKSVPKNISLTDPAAQWTAAPGGPAFYAYSTNCLIDTQAGIVMDVVAIPAHRLEEVQATKVKIDRVEERFAIKPQRLIGDTAYGTAAMLDWIVEHKHIEPHVPVWDTSERTDGTLSSTDFTWNEQDNEYRCPMGKPLRHQWRPFKEPRSGVTKANTIVYRASQYDCTGCPLKPQCCPNVPIRKILRSVFERSRERARQVAATPQY